MTSGARLTRRASELTDRTSRRLNFPLILPARSQSYSFSLYSSLSLLSYSIISSCLAPFRHSAVPILPRVVRRLSLSLSLLLSCNLRSRSFTSWTHPGSGYPMNIYAACNLIPRALDRAEGRCIHPSRRESRSSDFHVSRCHREKLPARIQLQRKNPIISSHFLSATHIIHGLFCICVSTVAKKDSHERVDVINSRASRRIASASLKSKYVSSGLIYPLPPPSPDLT